MAVLPWFVLAFMCGDEREDPRGGHRVAWESENGADAFEMLEFDGWEHCGWQRIRFIAPPTDVIPSPDLPGAFAYFVDATSAELPYVTGDFTPDVQLPDDARPTGYTQGTRELWFSPSESGSAAYIVDGGQVDRWPRFDGGCD